MMDDTHRCSEAHRHGTVLVAVVILMLLVNLAILGLVLGGARDHSTTVLRLDSARAAYAAEAGVHLALREVVQGMDVDGDGAVGSISDDGNPDNDPTIGGARTYVQRSGAWLNVRSQGSVAQREVQIEVATGFASGPLAIYGETTSTTPVSRRWTGAWSAEAPIGNVGGRPRWIVAAACPTRDEMALAVCDNQRDANVLTYAGSTWSTPLEVSANVGTDDDRPMSLAYERLSGDAMVVYRVGAASTIFYRTWDGAAWSAQQSTANLSAGRLRFLKLVSQPGSDQLILLSLDDTNDIVAMVWNGSAWGNKLLLDAGAPTANEECMDAQFEQTSSDGLVVWGRGGSGTVRYRTWASGAWSAESVGPAVGAAPRWIRLAADPAGDQIMLLTLDDDSDVNAALWSGTAWGAAEEFETSAGANDRRCIDVAFEPAGARALAIYAEGTVTTPRYRVYDGSAWSAEASGPDLADDFSSFVLCPIGSAGEILVLALTRGIDSVRSMRWTGAALVDAVTLEANGSSDDLHEAYTLLANVQAPPRIASLQVVEP